jgi:hypothetical protein
VEQQPLIFPPSIRFAAADELPGSLAEREEALALLANAAVSTGFVTRTGGDRRATVFAEANVHGPDVWSAFSTLVTDLLPERAAAVVGVIDQEPRLGHYTERDSLLAALSEFAEPLAADCFVEFGAMWQTPETTEEVFVRAAKYIQIWTNDLARLRGTMLRLGVPEVERLAFIDEFPRTTHATQHAGIGDFAALVERVVDRCAALPAV